MAVNRELAPATEGEANQTPAPDEPNAGGGLGVGGSRLSE